MEDLAKLAIQGVPAYVGVDDEVCATTGLHGKSLAAPIPYALQDKHATVSTLEQGYVVCDSEKRFLLLFTFLKKHVNKKVMVFFSSCNSVKFHSELLNYIDVVREVNRLLRSVLILTRCVAVCSLSWTSTASRSRQNAPRRSSTSARQSQASCCAPTWQHVVWTSHMWTGLFRLACLRVDNYSTLLNGITPCSTIHQTIRRNIFTALDAQHAEPLVPAAPCYSCFPRSWAFSSTCALPKSP